MKVTVIIPFWMQEDSIKRCLNALLEQTYRDFELIYINDGSEGVGHGDIDKMLSAMPNTTVIKHESHQGLWASRREGIRLAKGEYILFVDPREWLDHNAIERLVEAAEFYNADLVQMKRRSVVAKLHLPSHDHPDVIYDTRITGKELRDMIAYIGRSSCVSPFCDDKLYRRSILLEACMMDYKANWGEVQMMNINYMRHARSLVFINFCGVMSDWTDNYENYQFRRLQDYKYIYSVKKHLCSNQEAICEELRYMLHYHVRQLMTELVWTDDAVRYYMRNELNDPVWKEVGMHEQLEDIIEEERRYIKHDQWKNLFRRMLK